MGGRKPKLKETEIQEVLNQIALGVPQDLAMTRISVKGWTWDALVRRHPEVLPRLQKAKDDFVSGCLLAIHDAKQWQAKAWLLERRYTEHFGIRFAPQVNVAVGIGIAGDQLDRLRSLAREKLGTRRADGARLAVERQQNGQTIEIEARSPHSECGARQPGAEEPPKTQDPAPAQVPEEATPRNEGKGTEPGELADEW